MQHISLRRPPVVGIALAALLAVGLVGCSSAASSTKNQNSNPSASAASGTCGSVPNLGVKDPNGLLSSFSPDVKASYNGFAYPIRKSAWADWKPSHAGPYTAAIVGMPPVSDFIKTLIGSLKSSLDAAHIKVLSNTAPDDPSNVPLQLQQFGQAVAEKPDVIFFVPIAGPPGIQAVNQAGAAGIPVVSLQASIDSPYAVSVTLNSVLQSMEATGSVLRSMGGKGSVLEVTGIPGISTEVDAETAWKTELALCPNVKVAGQVNGLFVPTTAQTAVQQYLATNPAGVDGVFQGGTMGLGILNAFKQAGEKPVPIGDIGATQGFVSWASKNKSYPYVGTPSPGVAEGKVGVEIAERMFAGDGIKVNQLVWNPPLITRSNLSKFVDPSWSTTDSTELEVGADGFFPPSVLDQYFSSKK